MRHPLILLPFIILTVSVATRFFAYGMFVDGTYYANIARNLSDGLGSWWSLQVNPSPWGFFEHPPLAIWLQSLAFDVFGDSRYVEKAYSYVCGLLQLGLLMGLSQAVPAQKRAPTFFAALLFAASPLGTWIFNCNMLENTMMLACFGAVWAQIVGMKRNSLMWFLISGVLVFLAFMSKGVLGLFPLATPVAIGLAYGQLRQMVPRSVMVLFGFGAGMLLLWSSEESWRYMVEYYYGQVYNSVSGVRELDNPHAYILLKLLSEILPILGVTLVMWLLAGRPRLWLDTGAATRLWLLIALSASLPLVVSPKNRWYFLVLSTPFYGLALAQGLRSIAYEFEAVCAKRSQRTWCVLGLLMLAVPAVAAHHYQSLRFYPKFHTDFSVMPWAKPTEEWLEVCAHPEELRRRWSLAADFSRDYKVHLSDRQDARFHLVEAGWTGSLPASCVVVHPQGEQVDYRLYDCK